MPSGKYALGLTKLFMRAGVGGALEDLVAMHPSEMVELLLERLSNAERRQRAAIVIAAGVIGAHTRRRYLRVRKATRAIQMFWRRWSRLLAIYTVVRVAYEAHREEIEAAIRAKREARERMLNNLLSALGSKAERAPEKKVNDLGNKTQGPWGTHHIE